MKTPFISRTFVLAIVLISGFCGLTCRAAPFPAGADAFSNASDIVVLGDTDFFSAVTNIGAFSAEPGEPSHLPTGTNFNPRRSAWWKWTAPATGWCTIHTGRSAYVANAHLDTTLAVYTKDTLNQLERVVCNDDSPIDDAANKMIPHVTFVAQQGVTYRIAVDVGLFGSTSATSQNVVLELRFMALKKHSRSIYLIGSAGVAGQAKLGQINANITSAATLSGKLQLGRETFTFKGAFGPDGYFKTTLRKKGVAATSLPVSLEIDGAWNASVTVVDGLDFYAANGFPEALVFPAGLPPSYAGYYTAGLSVHLGDSIGGSGFATATVSSKGVAKGTAVCGDGTGYTFSKQLSIQAGLPHISFFKVLPKRKGEVVNIVIWEEGGAIDKMTYTIAHIRYPSSGSFYPAGFIYQEQLQGTTYEKPIANTSPYGFLAGSGGNGQLVVENAGSELSVASITEPLQLSTTNKFIFASAARKPSLKLNTSTGLVTGSITEPAGNKRAIKAILHKTATDPSAKISGFAAGKTSTLKLSVSP